MKTDLLIHFLPTRRRGAEYVDRLAVVPSILIWLMKRLKKCVLDGGNLDGFAKERRAALEMVIWNERTVCVDAIAHMSHRLVRLAQRGRVGSRS
jgi:hypothetical protein